MSEKLKNPNAGHRERLRQRYLSHGFDAFAEHEVLELILFYCYAQRDTKPIAKKILAEFGSLHNVFEADAQTIMATLKCTENVAVLLSLILPATNRYFRSKWGENTIICNEKIAGQFAVDLFVGETVEKFYVLCLDKNFKLINAVLISEGTVDEAAVYTREVIRAALQNNATAIILTHNHPGGTIKPSRGDYESTIRIIESANSIDIEVIDHVIAVGDKYYSFAARKQHVAGYGKSWLCGVQI
ncbi:MAG: DNA repair protein RadC [Defluviitaleaceae bacterium]|nr:DNA repair protein RadC [Defluviitaleaceae bacterium]